MLSSFLAQLLLHPPQIEAVEDEKKTITADEAPIHLCISLLLHSCNTCEEETRIPSLTQSMATCHYFWPHKSLTVSAVLFQNSKYYIEIQAIRSFCSQKQVKEMKNWLVFHIF